MAVVQLRLDPKGKAYSTIATTFLNDAPGSPHKQPPHQLAITNNNNFKNHHYNQHNSYNKKDLIPINSTKANCCKFRSTTAIQHTNGCTKNQQINGNNGMAKYCFCELECREAGRNRSESIKVDNWEYIYKEKNLQRELGEDTMAPR
jgi:hypothetical protein